MNDDNIETDYVLKKKTDDKLKKKNKSINNAFNSEQFK